MPNTTEKVQRTALAEQHGCQHMTLHLHDRGSAGLSTTRAETTPLATSAT